uniref:Uncharacterized protein n=1 Tax=Candidatus Kentrum sp. TUN TaxID=2126343 RepID=A0A450ZIP4_9GAMM|nr:MAG: hypothetical protein BECKTUN1418D_GA0071000_101838 [Candidatus Kentron sp. TUN]
MSAWPREPSQFPVAAETAGWGAIVSSISGVGMVSENSGVNSPNEWIIIVSAAIVVVGWFLNGYLNRRHEIAKKRMEYRLEMLHSFLPVLRSLQKYENPFVDDPNLLPNLNNSRSKFLLYGKGDEIERFEEIVGSIESGELSRFRSAVNDLMLLIRGRVRQELGPGKI